MSKSNISSNLDTPLMLAAREGDVVRLNELIESGVAIDEVDQNGRTAFLHASINGEFDAAKLLLKAGANINAMDNEGYTAAHLTILGRSSQRTRRFLSQLLIKHEADLTVCDTYGFSPLMLCAKSRYYKLMENGRPDLAKILIDAGVDVNYQNSNGWNALMFAAADGNEKICELLINTGADVHYKNSNGWNALMFAAADGHEKICELLINARVDVNYKNYNGWNALMFAAADGNKKICELLINAGAWPLRQADCDLNTILNVAKPEFKLNLETLLEDSTIKSDVLENLASEGIVLPASTGKIKAAKNHI